MRHKNISRIISKADAKQVKRVVSGVDVKDDARFNFKQTNVDTNTVVVVFVSPVVGCFEVYYGVAGFDVLVHTATVTEAEHVEAMATDGYGHLAYNQPI